MSLTYTARSRWITRTLDSEGNPAANLAATFATEAASLRSLVANTAALIAADPTTWMLDNRLDALLLDTSKGDAFALASTMVQAYADGTPQGDTPAAQYLAAALTFAAAEVRNNTRPASPLSRSTSVTSNLVADVNAFAQAGIAATLTDLAAFANEI